MNRLFLTAITGECCLMLLHNIRPRGYNPFVLLSEQLKKEGITINPKDRKAIFNQLAHLYNDNNIKYHNLLPLAFDKLTITLPNQSILSQSNS